MYESLNVSRLNHTDLNMYQCGYEDCTPGHSYGPAVRDHFLIHYILDGKGSFQSNGQTYFLEKGQGFLICPGKVTFYQADTTTPWRYAWVGFHGTKAEQYLKHAGLTFETPIFTCGHDEYITHCFQQMVETLKLKNGREIRLLGLLYLFLSQLIETNSPGPFLYDKETRREFYIRKTVEYIQTNYSRKITIAEIAHYIGLDRSYLSALFKEWFQVSLQQFLIHYRMDKACSLMQDSRLPIGDIARSVGYEDPLQFSKTFRKVKGGSPKTFRDSYSVHE